MPSLINKHYHPISLLVIGASLRFIQYLHNRSMWSDEIDLAKKIISAPIKDLIIYTHGQAAPPLFMLTNKLFVSLFGTHDLVLRLFPLITGILALPLFYKVAMHFLSKKNASIAFLLFCFLDNLIYYSSEFKQYHSDTTATLAILWLYTRYKVNPTKKNGLILLITGVLSIWLSHAVIFTCATVGLILLYEAFKTHKHTFLSIFLNATWALSFVTQYFLTTIHINNSNLLKQYWKSSFWPLAPESIMEILWLPINILRFSAYYLGLRLTWLPVQIIEILSATPSDQWKMLLTYAPTYLYILSLSSVTLIVAFVGIITLYKKDKKQGILFTLPMIAALCASALEKYPFQGRFLLFFFPFMTLLLVLGLDKIITSFKNKTSNKMLPIIFCSLVLFHPIASGLYHISNPRSLTYCKEIIQHVQKQSPVDTLAFIFADRSSVVYYGKQLNQNVQEIFLPENNAKLNKEELNIITKSKHLILISPREKRLHDQTIDYFNSQYQIISQQSFSPYASLIKVNID